MSAISHFFHRLEVGLFARPKLVLAAILMATLFFAAQLPGVKMYSDFADLLPQEHPYIELHNDIKDNFGGANVIVVGVEVADGTIFKNETASSSEKDEYMLLLYQNKSITKSQYDKYLSDKSSDNVLGAAITIGGILLLGYIIDKLANKNN